MERPEDEKLTPEIARYLDFLEGQLYGASNLLKELNLVADGYARDLMMIRTGRAGVDDCNLNYITSEKNDQKFNRTIVLLGHIKELILIEDATKQKIVSNNVPVTKKKVNMQDIVLSR